MSSAGRRPRHTPVAGRTGSPAGSMAFGARAAKRLRFAADATILAGAQLTAGAEAAAFRRRRRYFGPDPRAACSPELPLVRPAARPTMMGGESNGCLRGCL